MLSARILGTDGRAGTPPPGRLSPLGAGGIKGWESVAGSARHCLPYRFLFLSVREGEESPMAAPPTSVSPRSVAIEVAGLGGSADLTSEYRFLSIARSALSLPDRLAGLEGADRSSQESVASSAGQRLSDDRFLYRPSLHCRCLLAPSARHIGIGLKNHLNAG